MSRFELFHKIADPDSAAIRREISELGLKAMFDFRNVDTMDAAAADLVTRGGETARVPSVWNGIELIQGREKISALLAKMKSP